MSAPPYTYLPLTLVDVHADSGAVLDQELPGSYNGFVYVLEGDLVAGARSDRLTKGQVGWLDNAESSTNTSLRLVAGERGARAVLYAGERQGVPIVTHGPFVGESRADLIRISQAYIQGKMPKVSELLAHE